jgi:ubiquinone/menaquinone biosynthesis C-methylase UbiE
VGWVDGTTEFHSLIRHSYTPGDKILEIGAGPSNPTTTFLASLGHVWGLDPDSEVLSNTALTDARVLATAQYPFPDSEFGLCVSNYVVEHVADGLSHLKEVARVLRPGGRYVFRTVNRFHYLGLIASATPHSFHKLVANPARQLSADSHEPYPTVYAMNTARVIRRTAARVNLEVEQLNFVEKEPAYGRFSRIAYLAMMAYERAVNAVTLLAPFRVNLFVVLRKPLS